MRRFVALVVAGLMLGVPVVSAASYTQPGNGPQRTGAIGFEGPQTNDTAFQIQMPGVPIGQPSIIDGQVYVVTMDADLANSNWEGETDGLDETALWRIDLATAETERLFTPPEGMLPGPVDLGPDRMFLFDMETEEILAVEIPSGEELWRVRPMPEDPRDHRSPGDLVIVEDTAYIAFSAWGADAPETPVSSMTVGAKPTVGLMAIDHATGEVHWTRTIDDDGAQGRVCCLSLAADEDRVYPYMRRVLNTNDANPSPPANVYRSQFEIQGRSASSGAFLWNHTDTAQERAGASTPAGSVYATGALGWGCCAYPVITDTAAHIRLDAFEAINPASGERIWTSEAGSSDHIESQGSAGMGTRGDTLVATSTQTVYRLDRGNGDLVWQQTETDQWFAGLPIAIDGDTAYMPLSWLGDDCFLDSGMEARDLETGELRWRWWHKTTVGVDDCGHNNRAGSPAFGPGVMVWGDKDGTLNVVGHTEASLGEPDLPDKQYPDVGNETTIDASGSEPGAFGNATRYMVDWGDGTVSGWQTSPEFSHAYNESGEYQAQVYAGNDANQTSSTVVTMNVGQEAPAEPNWLSERFEPENQDMTFGVLGVALALSGGAIGVTQRYRKRSRLEEELETLEQGYEETKNRPGECEAFLETRRARARSLVLDGVLTEEQGTIIRDRTDELRRELRTQALEDEFGFLPYSLVTKARQMLEDGRVTTLEVEAFEAALDEVEGISDKQRTVVRERIEAWKARDEGGGGR